MTENIKKLAASALNNEDKFIKSKSKLKNEEELKSPVLIAEGLKRFFENVQVKEYSGEKLFGRLRFDDGCEYPADFYRRAGHKHLSS